MANASYGYVLAIIGAILNGSFLTPFKLDAVKKLKMDPFVFILYVGMGIFIASWIFTAFISFNSTYVSGGGDSVRFIPNGFASGIIFVLNLTCGFASAELLGIALAQGIFGGTAIITSYLWGTFAFNEIPENIPLSVGGVVMLVIGVVIIANTVELSKLCCAESSLSTEKDTKENPLSFSLTNGEVHDLQKDLEEQYFSDDKKKANATKFYIGIALALTCGLSGGSALVPLQIVPASDTGIACMASIGVGFMCGVPFVVLGNFLLRKKTPQFYFKEAGAFGILCGLIWNTQNLLAIGAIPLLGYSIAFPIIQCAIFVAGIWGIFYFHEVKGPAVYLFFAGGTILIIGAVLLSIARSS